MKKQLFILLSILTISCNKDETNNQTSNLPDNTALNLVTGVNFRETPNAVTLQFGNPNVLVNNKFLIYPNPASGTVYVSAQENVTDVWIVSANPEKIYQNEDFSSILNTNLYEEQSIISHSNFSLNGQSSNNFTMNIGTLEKGYYKVFVKIGGVIYWDNLYKYGNQENTQDQFTAIATFWN